MTKFTETDLFVWRMAIQLQREYEAELLDYDAHPKKLDQLSDWKKEEILKDLHELKTNGSAVAQFMETQRRQRRRR